MAEVEGLVEIMARWRAVIDGPANEGAEAGYQHGLQRAYGSVKLTGLKNPR